MFLLLSLLSLLSLGPALSDEEIVKEFRRYFRKYKDTPTRVEAVAALEGAEVPSVVDVLLPVLKDKEPQVVEAAVAVLASFRDATTIQHLLARLEKESDPKRRLGLLRAVARANYPGATELYFTFLEDGEWEVRRRAIQGLVKVGGADVEARIAPLCADGEVAVRCAALDALAQLRSKLVLTPARADLTHESWQVRASAIDALGRVRDRDSIEPLIGRLGAEEGRLREDIGVALANLTGRDFGQRIDAWQRFWTTFRERFVLPTDAQIEELRRKQKERREAYEPAPGAVTFAGVDTPSRRLVFVIDVSGSMEQLITQKELFEGRNYPSLHRIDIVKTELERTIEGLESYVEFNVLAFATDVKPWKKRLVKANPLNRSSAMTWVSRLEAIGGDSKAELARAGLVGAANLEAGKTNTYAALMAALNVEDDQDPTEDYEVELDTIFFLSDGYPSHGKYIETDDVLREVRRANQLRGVVIHTIAIGEFEKDFMRRLAEENGGTFVDLGF